MKKELIFWTREIGWEPSYNNFDEDKAIDLLQYAYSHWIRYFDTAPIYGNWKSEELLGNALKDKRKKENSFVLKSSEIVPDDE